MATVRTWIEPVVATVQFSFSFYDTGLLMVVKGYYNQTNSTTEDEVQKSISNFYIIYNLLYKLIPLLSAYIVTTLGDKYNMKITLCLPLTGFLVSSLVFLFVILWDWPIEVMFGAAAFIGMAGGFTTYWSRVMVWAALASTESQRSLRLIANDCIFGIAGFAGSLLSGHIFINLQIGKHRGVVLAICCLVGYTVCLLYVIIVLKIPHSIHSNTKPAESCINEDNGIAEIQHEPVDTEYTENSCLIDNHSNGHLQVIPNNPAVKKTVSKVAMFLLFISASLYNSSVNGAEDVLSLFVIKKPLNWGPVEVGYGNAAGYMIFFTSFLGVTIFSRWLSDLSLIIIGMFSFIAGILTMAFASHTYVYFIARAAMLFSLIPVPTIRSVLSKRVQESSYGKIFVVLQLILTVMGVIASTAFIEIYQVTFDWFSGFSFIVIFIIVVISFIPLSIAFCTEKIWKGNTKDELQFSDQT
uniref:Uncharacterized protein n=1 Tax=Leptobrachium leishanense TaxID=445787 RepID=A0A8C5LXT3_9ANUR